MYNRRKFIETTSLMTLATTLGSLLPFSARASANKENKLGIALVGLGSYATKELAPALEKCKNAYLAGIVTGTPQKAADWKAKYNLKDSAIYNYQNFDTIVNNPDIQAVYIVLPNAMHREFAERAARAGKHVISEKPMGINTADGQKMIDACKKAGKTLSIGYRLHFDPYHLEMMRLAREKVYGQVKIIRASFGFTAGDSTQWRLKKSLAGGGALMDVGIYTIQAARYISGQEPVAVTAQEFKTDNVKFKEVDETITWQLEFPNGMMSQHFTSYNAGIDQLQIIAEKGEFGLKPSYSYRNLKGYKPEGTIDFGNAAQQTLQMDAIAEAILNNKPSPVPGEEGLRDMKVIDAIYQSIAEKRRVMIG